MLSEDLPSIGILYLDNILVHTRRVRDLPLSPSGDYNFLTAAEVTR
jgi:peptide/nickel transport system substrate-binding protein